MALPCRTTGSLYSTFVPARLVGLTVKPAYAIALYVRLPSVLSRPLEASDTILEATTPVKLPTMQCPLDLRVRLQVNKGRYFKVGSTNTGVPASKPPAYPTHYLPKVNAKL
jgi:hypothetical protein